MPETDSQQPADRPSVDPASTENAGFLCGQSAKSNSPPGTTGDQGGSSVLSDPHRAKGDMVLLRRAIKNRWPVTAAQQGQIVEKLMELVEDTDPKIAASAVRTGVAIVDANIRIDMEDDKADRLDAGLATERVEMPVKFVRGTGGEGV